MRTHRLIAGVTLLLQLWVATAAAAAPTDAVDEGKLRAAMVFSLLKFVQWPTGTLKTGEPLQLCHIDVDDSHAEALARLRGKVAQEHPLQVTAARSASDLALCNVVVTGSRRANAPALPLPPAGVLTIGTDDFVLHGGMIGIVSQDDRLTLEFNVANLRRAQLFVPAQVLGLGKRVALTANP